MGGDFGLDVTIPAAISALDETHDVNLILVGPVEDIKSHLGSRVSDARLSLVNATQVVGMDESAANALRGKKDSSMRVAINQVRNGKAQACVSAGNTGALMATARFVLKTLPGISRPAIVTALPRAQGRVHVLDLGANVDVPAEILFQFGVMGATLVRCIENREPTVGLLNLGVEDIKGSDTIRRASELFRDSPLNYIGFVEGDEIFNGTVDVIVCDGFSGNVALKTSEGLAQMIRAMLKEEYSRNLLTRLAGMFSMPVLRSLGKRMDHRRYNGASLVGLRGTVIKSHGGTDVLGYAKAIDVAVTEVRNRVIENLEAAFGEIGEVAV
ncbi:MAG: phosphate acyltransferase [marine bacterium B5-7]|nr:MAG: phosphate acyltransferase [marine bacterium B5-7]